MGDPHAIDDLAALRRIIGEPLPGLESEEPERDLRGGARVHRARAVPRARDQRRQGSLDASPKGDGPGFCLIEDERTLVIPDRPGNKLVYGLQNILANPRVGVIFLLPGTPETVRVNGTATLTADPHLLARLAARGKPALLAIRIQVDECFHHCAKAFIRSGLWKPESWSPRLPISFGKMAAKRFALGDDVAQKFDAAVEDDYRNNL